jgi:hypothetical protein
MVNYHNEFEIWFTLMPAYLGYRRGKEESHYPF